MRLRINNFTKIRYADIQMNGITVIAGVNNTGKSTIGKTLYSLFNSFYDLDARIETQRAEEVYNVCQPIVKDIVMRGYGDVKFGVHSARARSIIRRICQELRDELLAPEANDLDREAFKELFIDTFRKFNFNPDAEISEELESAFLKINMRREEDDYKIALELIQRFFAQIFNDQMRCLKSEEKTSDISLTIKDRNLILKFNNGVCVEWNSDYDILHEAFFVDDPFVLDELSSFYFSMPSVRGMRRQLVKRLRDTENDFLEGVFDAVNAKENLNEIYAVLNHVTDGEIQMQNGSWGLDVKQFDEPLCFENLSAGLKSFVLIKMLLERGILKEKDVLILDEPEIHLHPEWQLLYAKIIVLLEKQFDLSIVVTTHSRDFLEAIELYAGKYGLENRCNYYLSQLKDGLAEFEDVTNCIEKIYKQLVAPSMLLDQIRYETEEDENEQF